MFIAFLRETGKKGRVGRMLMDSLKGCCKFVRTIALLFAVQALLVPIFSEGGAKPSQLVCCSVACGGVLCFLKYSTNGKWFYKYAVGGSSGQVCVSLCIRPLVPTRSIVCGSFLMTNIEAGPHT